MDERKIIWRIYYNMVCNGTTNHPREKGLFTHKAKCLLQDSVKTNATGDYQLNDSALVPVVTLILLL